MLTLPSVGNAGFASAFGVFSFAFGGHSLLPNFYIEMKHPSHWFRATQIGYWSVLLLMYAPMGIVGYLVYGEGLGDTSNILEAITHFYPAGATASAVVSGIIILHLLTAMPLVMTPVLERFERTFISKANRKKRSLPKLVVRVVVIAGLTVISIVVPYFLDLIQIVTALR